MQQNEVGTLRNQLTIARNEINKLRKQVKNLQLVQRKDIENLNRVLQDFRCEGCRQIFENTRNRNETASLALQENNLACNSNTQFHPIGVIRTAFAEKRAVPRQSSVGSRLRGVIELNSDVFTNPEHALDGLAEYSHLWIIYHFHKNTSHPKAKVAPPRLCGERRVGVFATRSPHRPCPIGLSLVEIDKVEAATISFFGTDMVDGTPVLDIKPYIPHYDAPNGALETHGGRISVGPPETIDFYNSRQDPDGEESELDLIGGGAMANSSGSSGATTNGATTPTNLTAVKVPNWVVANHRLSVCFNERAETQLGELREVPRQCIIDILEADPRSVYLRTKYGSQIFTFQLSEVTVTCKFDDKAGTVTVVQIRRTENVQDESGT